MLKVPVDRGRGEPHRSRPIPQWEGTRRVCKHVERVERVKQCMTILWMEGRLGIGIEMGVGKRKKGRRRIRRRGRTGRSDDNNNNTTVHYSTKYGEVREFWRETPDYAVRGNGMERSGCNRAIRPRTIGGRMGLACSSNYSLQQSITYTPI